MLETHDWQFLCDYHNCHKYLCSAPWLPPILGGIVWLVNRALFSRETATPIINIVIIPKAAAGPINRAYCAAIGGAWRPLTRSHTPQWPARSPHNAPHQPLCTSKPAQNSWVFFFSWWVSVICNNYWYFKGDRCFVVHGVYIVGQVPLLRMQLALSLFCFGFRLSIIKARNKNFILPLKQAWWPILHQSLMEKL